MSSEQKSVQAANTPQVATTKAQHALKTQCSCVCVRPSLLVLPHLLTRCHACLPLTPTPAGLENAPEVCLTYSGLRREAARAVFTLSAPAFFLSGFLSLCLSVLEIRGGACRAAAAERGKPWWRVGTGTGGRGKRWKDASWSERRLENLSELIWCNSTPARQEFIAYKQKLAIEKKCLVQPAEEKTMSMSFCGPPVLFT